jgi:hypothetical protein
MLEPDKWQEVLGRLVGTVYRGTERISSGTIMNALGVPTDQETRAKEGKRIVTAMRALGWTGPKEMRIDAGTTTRGYWRIPNAPPKAAPELFSDHELDDADDLPQALEQVTRLGLKELRRILRLPLDETNGNLLRAKVTASLGAIQAQLRADEQRLRTKTTGDALARLEKALHEIAPKIPKRLKAVEG